MKNRFVWKVVYGAASAEEVKSVTPMIYWSKYENKDGIVASLGFGWWHWYICFNAIFGK